MRVLPCILRGCGVDYTPMKAFLIIVLSLHSLVSSASLSTLESVTLDNILATYRNRPILMSDMKAVQKTLPTRRKLAPQLYTKHINTIEDLTKLTVKMLVIRDVLKEAWRIVVTE